MNQLAFTLLEAQVTLYLAQADGSPGPAVWSGAPAEMFRQEEHWLNVETRPSGRRYPKNHPQVPQYQLAIDRVWALPLADLVGFQPTEQECILEVIWTEEELQRWHRRVYYGVKISGRTLASRDIESGHVDNQEFLAEYFVADSGSVDAVPSPVVANPAYVLYRGADGVNTQVYTYAAGVYTNVSDGSLATVAADGSSIRFGTDDPVVTTDADGLNVPVLHDEFPTARPRLEFYAGNQLLAAVTADGFWARSYSDDYAGADGQFNFASGGATVAALTPGVALALAYTSTADT